jgi:hypothetical protein
VHIPSDGQPLPGYALALADVERRGGVPSGTSLEAARDAGVITASIEREAAKSSGTLPARGPLTRIFSTAKDEDEQSEQPAPKRSRAPTVVASLTPPTRVATGTIVPLPTSRPVAVAVLTTKPKTTAPTFTTASLPTNVFDNRGYWHGAVESSALPPPPQTPFEVASADSIGSVARGALAYAAESQPPAPPQVRPMGSSMPRLPATATVMPASPSTTVVVKPPLAVALASSGQHPDNPWMRAAMLTPSVSGYMTATRLGTADLRPLHELLLKPSQSLVMTFSADPHLGMVDDRFTGSAVVFLATATFTTQTASLR